MNNPNFSSLLLSNRSQSSLYSGENYFKELKRVKTQYNQQIKQFKQKKPLNILISLNRQQIRIDPLNSTKNANKPKIDLVLKPKRNKSVANFEQMSKQNKINQTVSSIIKPYLKQQLSDYLQGLEAIQSPLKAKQLKSDTSSQPQNTITTERVKQSVEYRQLSPLTVQKSNGFIKDLQFEDKELWKELRPLGKQPRPRAYHTLVTYQNKIYLFGGRDNNRGSYGDLFVFDATNEEQYEWKQVTTTGDAPLYLSSHSSVLMDRFMYAYGGRLSTQECSNQLYELDLITMRWVIKYPTGNELIPIDGHTAVLFRTEMVIFGGFAPKPYCKTIDNLQIYNQEKNTWTVKDSIGPKGRSQHSSCVFNDKMWIYGGTDIQQKYEDFWSYDGRDWSQCFIKGPGPRVGHVMFSDENRIYIFGGSQHILCEKNDLWSFNQSTWNCIENGLDSQPEDTQKQFHRKFKSKFSVIRPSLEKQVKQNLIYLNENDNDSRMVVSELPKIQIETKKNKLLQSIFNKLQKGNTLTNQSEMKEKERKLDRLVLLKKKQLLAVQSNIYPQDFEIDQDEQKRFALQTPITIQMQQSILSIENSILQNSETRQQGEKLGVQFAPQKLMNTQNIRPLPRDATSFSTVQNGWIIFGGDRHKVAFNDLWLLSRNQVDKYQN